MRGTETPDLNISWMSGYGYLGHSWILRPDQRESQGDSPGPSGLNEEGSSELEVVEDNISIHLGH